MVKQFEWILSMMWLGWEVSEVKGKERSWNYSCTVGEEKEGNGEEGKGAIAEK